MCNPWKSSKAELFSAISSWDVAQNEGWTFVLLSHIKKVSQFSVVRSVSAIILDHSEMPSALHQNIPWVNRRLLVCHKVQCDLSKNINSGLCENRIICRISIIYRYFSKISKQGVISDSRAIFWCQKRCCSRKNLVTVAIWIWIFL